MAHPYRKFRINRVREYLVQLFPGTEITLKEPPDIPGLEISEMDITVFNVSGEFKRQLCLFEVFLIRGDDRLELLLARKDLAHKMKLLKRGQHVIAMGEDENAPIEIREG